MAEELSPEEEQRRRAALAQVRKWGDPVLRERARPVEAFDDALRAEVARLTGLLDDALGAGLAATQIGVLSRVFVYRMPDAQHELDHLDGVLVLDRISQEQRKAAMRRLRELDAA